MVQDQEQAPASDSPEIKQEPERRFEDLLEDAERLLCYAAETGVSVEPGIGEAVLKARCARKTGTGLSTPILRDLLTAYTTLTAKLKPVTAETLKLPLTYTRSRVKYWRRWTIYLTLAITVLSALSFVNTSLSQDITDKITANNALAITLRAQLGPPDDKDISPGRIRAPSTADIVSELQEFMATLRTIDARAAQLDYFVFYLLERAPFPKAREDQDEWREIFELDPKKITTAKNIPAYLDIFTKKLEFYQKVRSFAKDIQEDNQVAFGVVSTFVLPILYAVIGACAYRLRVLLEQVKIRAYSPAEEESAARLLTAVIAGVINRFAEGLSLSPLAIAFLVGYAVEVFFSFLDGVLRAIAKPQSS